MTRRSEDGGTTTAASDAAVGDTELEPLLGGRFRLGARVGEGGMGEVHRGLDLEQATPVAIKVLYGTRHEQARFDREWRLLSALQHPGIVRYVAHGQAASGRRYLVMEWLDGETLADHLDRVGKLEPSVALVLVRRLAEALSAAHELGVVHRDIKPANVFLLGASCARPKILDFGLARRGGAHADARFTGSGMVIGTPGYMAPEQARASPEIDPRIDVFALGCVLFRCLAGVAPFGGDDPLSILLHTLVTPAPELPIPGPLAAVLAQMLAKDPADRPADAAEVAAKLADAARALDRGHPPPPVGGLTAAELHVASLLLIRAPDALAHDNRAGERIAEELARRHAPACSPLADGTFAIPFVSAGTGVDRAVEAARVALAVSRSLPDVRAVVASGRAPTDAVIDLAELVDRATTMLGAPAAAGVRIDEATRRRLADRFDVVSSSDGPVLVAERVQALDSASCRATHCVGRGRELDALERLYDEVAADGVRRAALVTAPSGVGKTRVLDELVGRVRARAEPPEIWTGCGESLRAEVAFGVVADVLRRVAGLMVSDPPASCRDKLQLRFGARAVRSMPVLYELLEGFHARLADEPPRRDVGRLGDKLRGALHDLALDDSVLRQPLLIVLDDMHWADEASLGLFERMLTAESTRPVLMVLAARPEATPRSSQLASIAGEHLHLPNLSMPAAVEVARQLLGASVDERLCSDVAARSDGNAFYLGELARAVGAGDRLPEAVVDIAQARIESLAPTLRRVLRAGSVYGDEFDAEALASLLDGDPPLERTGGLLRDLTDADLLVARGTGPRGPRYAFRHALVREAAYAMLTAADKSLGHRLAGAFLERSGDAAPRVVADHFAAGGALERSAPWLRRAADRALDAGDLAAAAECAELGGARAVDPVDAARCWLVRARVHGLRGQQRARQQAADQVLLRATPGDAMWCSAMGERAAAVGLLDEQTELRACVDELCTVAVADAARPAWVAAAAVSVAIVSAAAEARRCDRLLARMEEIAQPLGDDPATLARLHQARAPGAMGEAPLRALGHRLTAAELFDRAGDPRAACQQRMNAGAILTDLGLFAEAETELATALDSAARSGLDVLRAYGLQTLGWAVAHRGRLADAERQLLRSISSLSPQMVRLEGISRTYLAVVLILSGEPLEAEREARRASELLSSSPAQRAVALAAQVDALLAQSRATDAIEVAREARAALDAGTSAQELESFVRAAFADALHAVGEVSAARSEIGAALDWVSRRAATIDDPELRERFVRDAPGHARLRDRAARW